MPDLSGLDTIEVDIGITGSYDFTLDDIHTDSEVNTELYENDEDVRGDTYWTGSFVDTPLVLPDLVDNTGTDQTSALVSAMTSGDYAKVRLTKNNGKSMTLDKTLVKVRQRTESNVGNLDPWVLMFRDVDTSGIFSWS